MKKRYVFITIIIIITIIIQIISINITPTLKMIANKEINRFCQMAINNTPFPGTIDQKKLIKINRTGDEITTINFNTNYASNMGSKMVDKLEELFVSIEEGTYKKTNNSFYQRKFKQMSDNGGVVASIPIGALSKNPFLSNYGPKLKLKYATISAITSSVEKEIKSYGVNHIIISLSIVIKIKMMVLLPFYNMEFNKSYDYPLMMEVIEGKVPNWYQK